MDSACICSTTGEDMFFLVAHYSLPCSACVSPDVNRCRTYDRQKERHGERGRPLRFCCSDAEQPPVNDIRVISDFIARPTTTKHKYNIFGQQRLPGREKSVSQTQQGRQKRQLGREQTSGDGRNGPVLQGAGGEGDGRREALEGRGERRQDEEPGLVRQVKRGVGGGTWIGSQF